MESELVFFHHAMVEAENFPIKTPIIALLKWFALPEGCGVERWKKIINGIVVVVVIMKKKKQKISHALDSSFKWFILSLVAWQFLLL